MKEMTIREVQMISLDILKDVHDFCVKNDIKYSLCGGTLIGAIRHNGFVPWDDDVDIVMPRPEYDRFIHTYKSEKGYKLFCPEIDDGVTARIRLTKVCDMERTIMVNGPYAWTDQNPGIGIDVIPADGAPNTIEDAKEHIKELTRYDHLISIYRSKFASYKEVLKYDKVIDRVRFIIMKLLGLFVNDTVVDEFINLQKKYDYNVASFFCAGFTYGIGEWQPKGIFDNYILHIFEDTEFYVTSRYDQYLNSLFGNYLELPPEEKRVSHSFFRYYWK